MNNRFTFRRPVQPRYRVNENIRVPEVLAIDETGASLGVIPTAQAVQLARDKGLDLVEVSPLAQPPVAKILNFGQFRYQQAKQQTKSKKLEVKTIKLSFKIGQHDLEVRHKQVEKFLGKGHLVKVTLRLRGREKAMRELAIEKLQQFVANLQNISSINKPLAYESGEISITLAKK